MIRVDLGQQLEGYVNELVASGRNGSKSEELREGVRLVQARELRLASLDASLKRGIDDADKGRVRPASDVFGRLEAKYRAAAKAGFSRPPF
ncbi:type II toxin-antitoxin system ParD family antitoxin [Bradyrhizobium prioriisuperbiae]|uniref:type II toxin-antitoxin system ParD family antitoxin n=1 Tax=Bradyrhizobium prioriisuperbiae TaxID=2854389 RepID=UPI0028F1707B|nr:type II toxin-antitoxin system ParD family antitoxin [Bradyrhizobium prioritasuperba]